MIDLLYKNVLTNMWFSIWQLVLQCPFTVNFLIRYSVNVYHINWNISYNENKNLLCKTRQKMLLIIQEQEPSKCKNCVLTNLKLETCLRASNKRIPTRHFLSLLKYFSCKREMHIPTYKTSKHKRCKENLGIVPPNLAKNHVEYYNPIFPVPTMRRTHL